MRPARGQRGAVALELALTLAFLFPVMALLLFYGRLLYNYEVAQKAAHDATRYLASASRVNLGSTSAVAYELAVAQAIVQAEVSVLSPSALSVTILCDNVQCSGLDVPDTVSVGVQIRVRNTLPGYAPKLTDRVFIATQSMHYVGN
ncbi:Flp pilus assembly protein TadG [Duganella sp. 1224]|uniref:TadE/TadG family type IV pilus assembly protein n=1 Tax=Duganella sp. 1224 TaxID=2587052 RepID=UPI0015C7C418|nr:TadE/TadG family type IV pilus assembly protein [Duganella sp. 1224]NYE58987.1 Flp pilus assembly protein TadG [Duganella sp. 1224]